MNTKTSISLKHNAGENKSLEAENRNFGARKENKIKGLIGIFDGGIGATPRSRC